MFKTPIAVALIAILAFSTAIAVAAESYKEGDNIEVQFLGKWIPATVIATNPRGQVQAEYDWVGGPRRRAFGPDEVRFAYESGALARGRNWTAASGKFKIKAAPLGLEDGSVLLRKPDMTELKVAINKLSDSDKQFIKKLEKQLGPIAPKAAEIEEFEEDSGFGGQAWLSPSRVALEADPLPDDFKVKQGGVVMPMVDFFDRMGGLIPIGGEDARLLAVVENVNPGEPKPTRLIWTSLADQKVVGQQSLPGGEVVLDYHAGSKRLLTGSYAQVEGSAHGPFCLTVWQVASSDKQPKSIVRWKADVSRLVDPWARFVDGSLVVHRLQKQEYVAWDVDAKKLRYRVPQESFFAPVAVLSGGRKYLVMPEDKRVRIIEAATGRTLSTVPTTNGSSAVALSSDGTKLAVLDSSKLTTWDLTSKDAAAESYQAEAVGTPFTADIAWVGPETIAVDGRGLVLFSTKLKIALWNYEFDMNAVRAEMGRRLRAIVRGHLIYAASVDTRGSIAVGAVALPGPKVEEVAEDTARESLLIIKPGADVRLQVTAGEHQQRVEAAITKQVEQNGWKLNPSSSNILAAEMKRGETQSTTYKSSRTGESQSVTITPYISSLQLKVGEKVAWTSGTGSGLPPMIMLQQGQSAQAEAEKSNRPYPEFFETVDIPESILDPAKRNGLGTTSVTNRGLVPKEK